jgi:hypothetical protein
LNPEERLTNVVSALESIGLSCLVMGGHAVRHYGLQRYTNDFDLTLARTTNPISQAFLLAWDPDSVARSPVVAIEPLIDRKLRSVNPASPLHRSLVEVVRRQYKAACQDRHRADKQRIGSAFTDE